MSKIEELPDDFDESLDLNKSLGEDEASMDDLYDRAMARGGLTNKTFEEVMSDISKTPLFMTDLKDAGDDQEANDLLEAIRAIQYEGTKAEIAQNFKEQGNECVAVKQWKDAREHYSKGIALLLDKSSEDKWQQADNMQEELSKRDKTLEVLYTNRARCNLEMQNYRSTSLDCAAALKMNPANVKAHYRSATALFALDKVYEALDVCFRGLKIDPENVAMKNLLEKIRKRSRVKETQDRKRRAEQERKKKEKLLLATALDARNIRVRETSKPPDLKDAEIRLSPDPLSPKSTLEFPLMLLYPMHNQSDFIKAYGEKDALIDHLGYILPLPWDAGKEYRLETVDCYMDTIAGGLVKAGKKLSLLELLSNGKIEVVDGLVKVFVVPRSLAPAWIAEVKAQRDPPSDHAKA